MTSYGSWLMENYGDVIDDVIRLACDVIQLGRENDGRGFG